MSPVSNIRKKAFEEEMRYVVPELWRMYGDQTKTVFKVKLETHLNKIFFGYMSWQFVIDDDATTFNITLPYNVDYTQFLVEHENK